MKSSNNLAKQTRLYNFYKVKSISFFLLITLFSVVFWSCSSVSNNTELVVILIWIWLLKLWEVPLQTSNRGLLTVYMTPYLISLKLVLVMERTKHFHIKEIKKTEVDVVLKNHSVILMTVPMVFTLFLLSVVLKKECLAVPYLSFKK